MSEGTLREYYNIATAKYNNLKQKYLLNEESEEYQRMLAGIRVYFSLMKQRTILTTLIGFAITSMLLIFSFLTLYYFLEENPVRPYISKILYLIPILYLYIVGAILFFNYIGYDFRLKNGIKRFLQNKIMVLILVVYLGFLTIFVFFNKPAIDEFLAIFSTIVIMVFLFFYMFGYSRLNPESLIKYALEKLEKSSREIEGKRYSKYSLYIQYYYAVLTYYKLVAKKFRNNFKDDILIRTKINLVPLLCSQGLISESEKREKLNSILRNLGKINPFLYPNKLTNEMCNIEKDMLNNNCNIEIKNQILEILREKTVKEKLKEYLFYFITAMSILSIIINTFFREIILNLLSGAS